MTGSCTLQQPSFMSSIHTEMPAKKSPSVQPRKYGGDGNWAGNESLLESCDRQVCGHPRQEKLEVTSPSCPNERSRVNWFPHESGHCRSVNVADLMLSWLSIMGKQDAEDDDDDDDDDKLIHSVF